MQFMYTVYLCQTLTGVSEMSVLIKLLSVNHLPIIISLQEIITYCLLCHHVKREARE